MPNIEFSKHKMNLLRYGTCVKYKYNVTRAY